MKIPLILIKSKTHIDSDLYDMRVNGDWHEFSKQDLKDLRSLIDTVLKEERKIGGHTYSKSGKDMCCQPLTEGEYGKPDFIGKDDLGALEQVHKDMSEGEGEDLEVEEDTANLKIIKKTLEEGIKIVSDARKEVHEKYPHLFEDKPVQKLPSERVVEIFNEQQKEKGIRLEEAPNDVEYYLAVTGNMTQAILKYLDEQSKK